MDKQKITTVSLAAERDTALNLAEQAELKAKEMQIQAEQMLEEGYAEAYEMIDELREKVKKQEREITRLLGIIEELKAKGTADNSTAPLPTYPHLR
jgi:hypothetical protein